MAMTIHVDVVSAEQSIYSGTALEVVAPAEMGDVGIMPRHTPLISRLRAGEVKVKPEDGSEEISIFVSGGILEIQPHVITVLADTGMRAEDLDEAQALEAKQRAEEALADRDSDIDYATAQSQLVAAAAQLRMLDELRKKVRR